MQSKEHFREAADFFLSILRDATVMSQQLPFTSIQNVWAGASAINIYELFLRHLERISQGFQGLLPQLSPARMLHCPDRPIR